MYQLEFILSSFAKETFAQAISNWRHNILEFDHIKQSPFT